MPNRFKYANMRNQSQRGSRIKVLVTLGLVLLSGLLAIFAIASNVDELDPNKNSDQTSMQTCDSNCMAKNAYTAAGESDSPALDLAEFYDWLAQNNASGFVGEFGWPAESSDRYLASWDNIASNWVSVADQTDLWTTAWASGGKWGDNYALTIHGDSNGDGIIDTANSQINILSPLISKNPRKNGVNLAGLEFGTQDPSYSNTNPGLEGTNYFAENPESLRYLSESGIKLIRLPITWERLQPTLGGGLNQTYIDQITTILDAATLYDIDVILDLHNYAEYKTSAATLRLGSTSLPLSSLQDVWVKIVQSSLGSHESIIMYDIMNEPHDVVSDGRTSEAQTWEIMSQQVLTSIRLTGDKKTIAIPGYDWSDLADWSDNHPESWITDPLNNFIYTAHHYWDEGQRGQY